VTSRAFSSSVVSTAAGPGASAAAAATAPHSATHDIAVIGGGIMGLAVSHELQNRYPHLSIALCEKEPHICMHQTLRNSGVIHAGIYYKPGSQRALMCVKGAKMMYQFCDQHNIMYKKPGKLIVATDDIEVERLHVLYERGLANGVPDLELIEDSDKVKQIEPNVNAKQAIWSPFTGIVRYYDVAMQLAHNITHNDRAAVQANILCNFPVTDISLSDSDGLWSIKSDPEKLPQPQPQPQSQSQSQQGGLKVGYGAEQKPKQQEIRAKFVVNCAGLFADRIAQLTGGSPSPAIVPVRGRYLALKPHACQKVSANIYPVPDPRYPWLGVHLTPTMDGQVLCGPNAVLGFAREGYTYGQINMRDIAEYLSYSGLQKLMLKHWSYGAREMYKDMLMSATVMDLQKLVPWIKTSDVERADPARNGVRALAVDEDGSLIEDFVFENGTSEKILHLRNAPSPACTASLAIAQQVCDRIQSMQGFQDI
jgi:2-hydroxyglutarate dehydrogenase